MLYSSHEFLFEPNYKFGQNIFTSNSDNLSPPFPPVSGNFLLLDNTNFLLLDGTDFLLL